MVSLTSLQHYLGETTPSALCIGDRVDLRAGPDAGENKRFSTSPGFEPLSQVVKYVYNSMYLVLVN
jgi:hypothetical protein